ncbi:MULTISPECIES: tetratricopeptide repeat protein [unclassified Staphylococcus]|uniref:tetratricopeptide repeat protein n=1 Tax=unclassified Staphylococcus TaxID=91994 RepID=UPI0021D1B80E|nr:MULTISPECIES: tetratricopeptide repeat protein [unclassified Staphylococcus]UXR70540.1 tetratricopeptide repeat protein [Staphylococcus sp. IVB6246]UXR70661.1 tetratricopeptide repeat protein [Staphylococcus sp. IVB6240]UXR72891.1 tetratricopeptide repeat protein [Staphylococcus sp. IVB6238]UXR75186.1 tetratricopeptide repeat protein [Staphylococcus sp. IVB6233]UXR81367.1 tetratricopeptide repeat protein [Staphylococcus sp. IVB6218]
MEQEQIHNLIKQGQFEKALQACFDNIEAAPEEIENYINSGILLAEAGEIEKSERFFQHAITLQPDNGVVYYNLANVYFNEGRFQEAIKLYQTAISKQLETKDVYFMLGMSFVQLEAKDKALPFLMRASELDTDFQDIEAQFQYGLVLCELEMFDQAIPLLQRILEKDSKHADAQYNLTLAQYMTDEDIDAAIKGFEQAIEMDDTHMLSHHAIKTFKMIQEQEG